MSRLVLVFFALLLPFQFAWSAAAAYCTHESTQESTQETTRTTVMHFGHHEHMHSSNAGQASEAKGGVHADCHVCNATGTPLLTEGSLPARMTEPTSIFAALAVSPPASALARAPDRPQWLRLA